ncbi:hypothetical protein [Arthrobacter sulfonylureivorans]|uniref:Uncharacterized protein n=1 Tax=Arthrobacter sulfonylureivorans TaxID=2486855 RepID=A0ABY3W9T4_9MICC|nr:hypothetical protein [Arthrobacter sulfonylureivorans]UNK47100.1 hypothetical protein MNQ99_07090 [Arthrobacter sulfonylureivorans]
MSPQQPSDRFVTPALLKWATTLALILAVAAIAFGLLIVPMVSEDASAFVSALVGSFVGSVIAFGGAALLWRMERKILVQERVEDRRLARTEELKRQDERILHECLTTVGQLRALDYHLPDEGRWVNERDKYRMTLKFRDGVSLISDAVLREELDIIASLIDDDNALDHFVMPRWQRIDLVSGWLISLLANHEQHGIPVIRPKNYDKLVSDLQAYYEHQTEQMELHTEWEEERERRQRESSAND